MNILFVGYRDKNHSSAGGYDKIRSYPNSSSLMGEDVPLGFIPVGKRGKCFNLFFLRLFAKCISHKYDIIHYFYGEMIRPNLLRLKSSKVVVTIHLRVKENSKLLNTLKLCDGVLTLSTAQEKELKRLGVKAQFIPHGFDSPAYHYRKQNLNSKVINVVVSGTNYRDFDTLFYVIEYCNDMKLSIHFHLLGQRADVKLRCENLSNTTCHPRLSDDDYFSLIRDCDYSFLPLTFATANNALLEAQFLGIKSILPRIEGILDYAAPEPLNMFYSNLNELVNIFVSLDKQSESDEKLSAFALKFEWRNIYSILDNYYQTLNLHE